MAEERKLVSVMGVHASYAKSRRNRKSDMVLVKEKRTYDDDTTEIVLRYYKDYNRHFWITKPNFKNHKSKKEWESVKHLDRFKTTQAELTTKIARALNTREAPLRRLARSPYLYGGDVDVTTIILHKYIEQFGQGQHLPTVAVMDFEWDIDTQKPTIGSYCYENDVYLTIRRDMITASGYKDVNAFVAKLHKDFIDKVQPIYDKFYDEHPKIGPRRKFQLHTEIVDLDLDVVRKLFRQTHIDQPDYLTFWNGIADFTVIMPLCAEYEVDPSSFMNDPSVPAEFRYTELVVGPTETIDANGNAKRKKNSEQWHVLRNMASWQFIDMMCCYHHNRAHKADLPSYAFDYVIPLELDFGKLRLVPELEEYEKTDPVRWHNEMSKKNFLEYALYATGDVIGPRILEDKTFEISGQSYPNLTFNPISDFKKNPRLLCNAQHFGCLEDGAVVGTTSDQMREDLDELIYAADNWIITLNSSYHDTLATPALSDSPIDTLYIPSNDDGDLTSSYPSNQRLMNIARCTTVTEIIKVNGIPEEIMRELGMDLSSCNNNSIDFCTRMFNMPHLQDINKAYNESMGVKLVDGD